MASVASVDVIDSGRAWGNHGEHGDSPGQASCVDARLCRRRLRQAAERQCRRAQGRSLESGAAAATGDHARAARAGRWVVVSGRQGASDRLSRPVVRRCQTAAYRRQRHSFDLAPRGVSFFRQGRGDGLCAAAREGHSPDCRVGYFPPLSFSRRLDRGRHPFRDPAWAHSARQSGGGQVASLPNRGRRRRSGDRRAFAGDATAAAPARAAEIHPGTNSSRTHGRCGLCPVGLGIGRHRGPTHAGGGIERLHPSRGQLRLRSSRGPGDDSRAPGPGGRRFGRADSQAQSARLARPRGQDRHHHLRLASNRPAAGIARTISGDSWPSRAALHFWRREFRLVE